jgi:hypothetical protein
MFHSYAACFLSHSSWMWCLILISVVWKYLTKESKRCSHIY